MPTSTVLLDHTPQVCHLQFLSKNYQVILTHNTSSCNKQNTDNTPADTTKSRLIYQYAKMLPSSPFTNRKPSKLYNLSPDTGFCSANLPPKTTLGKESPYSLQSTHPSFISIHSHVYNTHMNYKTILKQIKGEIELQIYKKLEYKSRSPLLFYSR